MWQLELTLPERLPGRDLAAAVRAGDRGIAAGAEKARRIDQAFIERACAHVCVYLSEHGISSGELLTDSCKLAGIKPGDDRDFGIVYRTLLKRGLICWKGDARRVKGHGSHGGALYALVR